MQTVEMDTMMKYLLAATVIAMSATVADAADSKKTRFWNLVSETVSKFELAPAGTTNWGPDQCCTQGYRCGYQQVFHHGVHFYGLHYAQDKHPSGSGKTRRRPKVGPPMAIF